LYRFGGNGPLGGWDYFGLKTVSGWQTDRGFTWEYKFDAEFFRETCVLQLQVNIELVGFDFDDKFHMRWWMDFDRRITKDFKGKRLIPTNPNDPNCCCEEIALGFRVVLTNNTALPRHHEVALKIVRANLRNGVDRTKNPRQTRMTEWHDSHPGIWLHEVIHMFGVKDEYVDPGLYPGTVEKDLPSDSSEGIMRDYTKPVLNRHIDDIVSRAALDELKGCKLSAH